MSTIISRIAAIGIIAGGFALTGDLGQLARRGLDVINARDVPAARADEEEPSLPSSATPAPTTPDDSASAPAPAAAPASRPQTAAARSDEFRPPRNALDSIDVGTLSAGERVVVWLAMPRRSGGRAYRCMVFDIIDPATADALAYEAVSFGADGAPQATAAPPRRVVIEGGGPDGRLVAGGTLDLRSRAVAATDEHETIGPVAALDLVR